PERNFGVFVDVDRIVKDGEALKLIGKQVGQKTETDLARGTYDAESKVLYFDFPSRGGTFAFRRDGDDSAFYPRGKHPAGYAYRPPPARDDGWPTGALEEVDIDRAGVEKMIETLVRTPITSVHSPQVEGILVARHGKLVLEEYFHSEHRDKLHDTR